jgi:hypothetical protein
VDSALFFKISCQQYHVQAARESSELHLEGRWGAKLMG